MFMDQFDDKISIAVKKKQKIDILTKLWPYTDSVWGSVWGFFGTVSGSEKNVTEATAHQGLALHEKDWETEKPRNPRNPN